MERRQTYWALAHLVEGEPAEFVREGVDDGVPLLWKERLSVAERTVSAPAETRGDVVAKASLAASLLAQGELTVGLTPSLLEDCERVLAAREGEARCRAALEPALREMRDRIHERLERVHMEFGRLDSGDSVVSALGTAWSELQKALSALASYEVATGEGLGIKAQVFEECLALDAPDAFIPLQLSYLRDFRKLARTRNQEEAIAARCRPRAAD